MAFEMKFTHKIYTKSQKENIYRKFAIDTPEGLFFATHNFWISYLRTMIYLYFERMQVFLSEYIYMKIVYSLVYLS